MNAKSHVDVKKLHDRYIETAPRAIRLRDAIVKEIGHLLARDGVTLGVPVEARVKDWHSIEEKVVRKSLELKSIADLDDLVGLRLILLFRRDLDVVDGLLRNNLTIRSAEDTSLRLTEAQFGYQSQHYVISLPDSWLKLPSFADLGDLRAEIQVRTLAQHIWAAASHKLQYKHEASVPLPLRRSIHRASALPETVDMEFDRLLTERATYVEEELPRLEPDTPLNVEIVELILAELLPKQNRDVGEHYDDLLIDLNHFGITTAAKLRHLLESNMNAILQSEAAYANGTNDSHYFTHAGLAREGLRISFGENEVTNFLLLRQGYSKPSATNRSKARKVKSKPQ